MELGLQDSDGNLLTRSVIMRILHTLLTISMVLTSIRCGADTNDEILSDYILKLDEDKTFFLSDYLCNEYELNGKSVYQVLSSNKKIIKKGFGDFVIYQVSGSSSEGGDRYRVSIIVLIKDGSLFEVMRHFFEVSDVSMVDGTINIRLSDDSSFFYKIGSSTIEYFPLGEF